MTDQPNDKIRRADESFEKRGGYVAPKKPFKLPKITTGTGQGATPNTSTTTNTDNTSGK